MFCVLFVPCLFRPEFGSVFCGLKVGDLCALAFWWRILRLVGIRRVSSGFDVSGEFSLTRGGLFWDFTKFAVLILFSCLVRVETC